MSRVGNAHGPSKDDILASIPLSSFRCTPEEVQDDIYAERDSTINGSVDPVKIDEDGKPYCEFCGPDGSFRRYLDDSLHGDILVDLGTHIWMFAVRGKHPTPYEYVAVLSDGQCELTPTPDGHLQITGGELTQGTGIAEQVAAHQWRLKTVSPQAA